MKGKFHYASLRKVFVVDYRDNGFKRNNNEKILLISGFFRYISVVYVFFGAIEKTFRVIWLTLHSQYSNIASAKIVCTRSETLRRFTVCIFKRRTIKELRVSKILYGTYFGNRLW